MKFKQKLMVVVLTLTMMGTYLSTLGNVVIAASNELMEQNSKTNHANVEFDSYFEGEEHSKTFEIGQDAKIYLKVKVNNTGYLKNGVVQFSNANFEIDTSKLSNENIQSSSKNEIKLNQINNSSNETVIEVPIVMLEGETVDSDLFSKISIVTFTGTYIDGNGKEKAIEKEISNEVKWQTTAEIELAGEVRKFVPYEIGQEKGVLLQAIVKSGIKDNSLPIENTKIEVSIPELKVTGENSEETNLGPARVTVVANTTVATNGKGSNEFSEANYKYNEETRKIEIEVSNQAENGKISWKKNVADEYVITYIYTGEEIYNSVKEQLEKAQETIKTEEEKEVGEINENAITGEIEVAATIKAYNGEETNLNRTGKISYSIEEKMEDVLDSSITSTNSISKGYIYANYAKDTKKANGENIEDKKDSIYEVNYTVQIYDRTLINEVTFESIAENYIDNNEEEHNSKVDNKESIYSKTVKIAENVFNKMLGQEGKVEITNKEGTTLAEITKDTEKDSIGNYVANIEEAKVNEIIIKTSKPITEGSINIIVEKAVSADQSYSKEKMENFEKIALGVITRAYITVEETSENTENQETEETTTRNIELFNNSKTTETKLTEPISKAEISIETENLSTVVENEDVELRVVLDTSSYENALYKNPVLKIVLPENIETVDLKNVNILLDNELKIKDSKVEEENGRKVILIALVGTQTKYMDNGTSNTSVSEQNIIAKGANIVIKADISFEKLAPSASANILLYYTNENSNLYEKTATQNKARSYSTDNTEIMGLASTEIEIVSPNGVVTESHMSGYDGTNSISSTETEKKEETVKINSTAKEVTIGGTIVNNYANSIENVLILGRIPFSGNQQIDGATELGSNFTMKMLSELTIRGIDGSKVKVYYSANGQATKDLINTENAWTEEPANLEEVKSYLIVLSGEVETGAQFSFDYKVELPENLSYNNSSYTTYKVYYDNKMEDATLGETKVAGTIGLTTGAAPDVSVQLQSTADTVREGQIVKMKAIVKNNGSKTVNNIKVNIPVPENAIFIEYVTGNGFYEDSSKTKVITVGNLAAGESKEVSYYIKFDDDINSIIVDIPDEDEEHENMEPGEAHDEEDTITDAEVESVYPKEITHQVTATADDISIEIPSNNYSFNLEDAQIALELVSETSESQVLKEGEVLTYTINLTNISGTGDLSNTVVSIPLPEGTRYQSAEIKDSWSAENGTTDGITYNEENNTVVANIGTLTVQKTIMLYVEINEFTGNIAIMAKATADGAEEHYSNITEYKLETINLMVSELTSTPRYVKEGDNVTYTLTLTNNGESNITGIKVSDSLPGELTLVKATYTYGGAEQSITNLTNGKVEVSVNQLAPGESTTINLIAKAGILPDTNDKEINNSMTVSANNYEGTTTNEVTNIIEYYQTIHDQANNDNPPSTSGRYKITGTAWLDENKDGERTDAEGILAGIQVMLINESNGELVTDVDTGEKKIVTTNSNGQYEFLNLTSGEYLVIFIYDAGKYSITEYQANEVDEGYNSDAINMKITLDGEQHYAGVTDTIRITDSNVRDIDIGLYVAEKFDLKLDKYISKITLTTPTAGTKVYYYDNSKLTKQEVYAKDINNSSIVVEYKIVVTNEGQIAGYAKKIIDYLPEDARFSSELNQDWYISDNNGAVYNTALANEKIEPGQSREVTLILSLSITDKNIGAIINNNAEIYESYNDQGIQDYDSQEANRLESEDDMSNADIMLSLSTGKIIIYTTLSLAIVTLLGFGIFEIKRRVLDKKNN